jgi:DNA-binding SARP family transcriptional activator
MGLRLYRGDFLEGFRIDEPAFDDWMVMHRLRLRQRAIEAHEAVMQHSAMNGHFQDAIHFALKLLAMDPLLESAHRALIRLYANAGQIGAALRQYENCVRALDVELQVGPQAETVELVRELRRGRPRADIMPSLT